MTGLLICATVVALAASNICWSAGVNFNAGQKEGAWEGLFVGLALIAVALWLAYAAGSQP